MSSSSRLRAFSFCLNGKSAPSRRLTQPQLDFAQSGVCAVESLLTMRASVLGYFAKRQQKSPCKWAVWRVSLRLNNILAEARCQEERGINSHVLYVNFCLYRLQFRLWFVNNCVWHFSKTCIKQKALTVVRTFIYWAIKLYLNFSLSLL